MTGHAEQARARDREMFAEAVDAAYLPTLLMVLVQLTGELRWLQEPFRPRRSRGLRDDDTGGLPPEVQAEVRRAALEAIMSWRAGTPVAIPHPSEQLIVEMLGVSAGEAVSSEYGPMLAEVLGCGTATAEPRVESGVPPDGFTVLIVGAGLSGLAMAVKLQEMGIRFTIVERRGDVGGTWLENRYPGAGVDAPSHLYSYSFASYDWPEYFARRPEVHAYIRDVAEKHRLTEHVRFHTDVVRASYEAQTQSWAVLLRTSDGRTEEVRASVLISAVGAFNTPVVPAIKGLDTFAGPSFHTARWPEDLDVTGRRVAVVGNGASAMQVVPTIAGTVDSLCVFQRSRQWVQPLGPMIGSVPAPVRLLLREVDLYARWNRVRWAWFFHDKLHSSLQKDPTWPHPERSLNAVNDSHRAYFTAYIREQLADRPDLIDRVLPDYPPFGKRLLLDWGWYQTLKRDNVELVTSGISEVRSDRIIDADGVEHEVDVIVLATGFDVVRFISSFEVRGRSGRTLREVWDDDDGRAYLGLAVPDFPNFFCLYGPNTQPGHGGSLIHTVEAQIHYISDLLDQMFRTGIGSLNCRQDVFEDYNKRVDAAHDAMVWTHPGMTTYYRNSRNRVVVNMPFRNLDYWKMTRHADLAEYEVESSSSRGSGSPEVRSNVDAIPPNNTATTGAHKGRSRGLGIEGS